MATRRSLDLVVNLSYRTAHHLVARNVFVGAEDILSAVVAVNMSRDKVHRDLVLNTMLNKYINPRRLCCSRTTDAQSWTDTLYRSRSAIVELPISGLLRFARPEVDVGLIPYLEIPVGDFIDAVALDEVPGELGD